MQTPLIQGALLLVLSELCLVIAGAIIRHLATELPNEVIVFVRNLAGLLFLLPWVVRRGPSVLRTERLRLHLMRAGVGVAAMYCLYYAWGNLTLAEAALMKQTAPFFIPLIAWVWLGEGISWLVRWAILVGFVGVVFVLNPQTDGTNPALLVGLGGAVLGGLAKVTIRRMTDTEPSPRIVFYFALFTALLSLLPALWAWHAPSLAFWGLLALMAGFSTLAQLLLSRAYALAPAGQLGPFTYSSVIFATLLGWMIWGDQLALHTLLGIGLITLAGTLAMLGKGRGRAPAVRSA